MGTYEWWRRDQVKSCGRVLPARRELQNQNRDHGELTFCFAELLGSILFKAQRRMRKEPSKLIPMYTNCKGDDTINLFPRLYQVKWPLCGQLRRFKLDS